MGITSYRLAPKSIHLMAGWTWLALLIAMTACSPRTEERTTRPVTVTEATVQIKDVPTQMDAIGTVKAFATVEVRSMVRGPLSRVAFQQGDEVQAGDLIFEIDPRPFRTAVDEARAHLERSRAELIRMEADYRRAAELLKDKFTSEASYDQSRAALASAKATVAADEAALARAELEAGYCSIRAPITGRIGTLLVNAGNIVKDTDTILANINQTRPVYVDFSLPERLLADVRRHMIAGTLTVTAKPTGTRTAHATGELRMINNAVDTATGTILLRAVFPNEDEVLWPGQFVNATLTLAVQRAAVVPTTAIQVGQQGPYVFVIQTNDVVELRNVTLGAELDGETVVIAGVQSGERVVTSNHLRLTPGAKAQTKGAAPSPAQ